MRSLELSHSILTLLNISQTRKKINKMQKFPVWLTAICMCLSTPSLKFLFTRCKNFTVRCHIGIHPNVTVISWDNGSNFKCKKCSLVLSVYFFFIYLNIFIRDILFPKGDKRKIYYLCFQKFDVKQQISVKEWKNRNKRSLFNFWC